MSEEEQPDPISFQDHVFDFSFHPTTDLVAVGLINGMVECYKYSAKEENSLKWSTQASKKSCRGIEFTNDGCHVMSISRDKSIQALDVSTGRLLYKIPKAHKYAINKICKLDTHLTATGDDEGIIKIWDMRTCKSVQEYHVHQDFISDFYFHENTLLSVAGDGLLSIHDIRKSIDKITLTKDIEDELLSMTMINNNIVCGSQSGALYIWKWNNWTQHKKWIGHPSSVDTLCKLDENSFCTGASDGLLRMISLDPQNFEGILGDHGQDFPIESVQMNYNHTYLASCGHDLKLRFWNIQFLFEQEEEKSLKRLIESDESHSQSSTKRSRGQFFESMV